MRAHPSRLVLRSVRLILKIAVESASPASRPRVSPGEAGHGFIDKERGIAYHEINRKGI